MITAAKSLPEGYRLQFHETIDSTNSEALRLADRGEPGNIWIMAASQDAGRGRSGRRWESLDGNLFTSLLIYSDCPPRQLPELGFVAGVALHDTVTALVSNNKRLDVVLKWPNDLLLNGKKLAGLLLESKTSTKHGLAVAIGFGMNIASHPLDPGLAATSLHEAGIETSPNAAMGLLAEYFERWRSIWNDGSRFDSIRAAWLDRSMPAGAPISVHAANGRVEGVFAGIDEDGALLLGLDDNSQKRVTAGDIFPL